MKGKCRVCGCTDLTPCVDLAGVTCHWLDFACTVCSRCIATVSLDELDAIVEQLKAVLAAHPQEFAPDLERIPLP